MRNKYYLIISTSTSPALKESCLKFQYNKVLSHLVTGSSDKLYFKMSFLVQYAAFPIFLIYFTLIPCSYGSVISNNKENTGKLGSVANHAAPKFQRKLNYILRTTKARDVSQKALSSDGPSITTPIAQKLLLNCSCFEIVNRLTCKRPPSHNINETVPEILLTEDDNDRRTDNETIAQIENAQPRKLFPAQATALTIRVCGNLNREYIVKSLIALLRKYSPSRCFFSSPSTNVVRVPRCETKRGGCWNLYVTFRCRRRFVVDFDN